MRIHENIITLEGERIWVETQDDLEGRRYYHYEYRDIILYTELQDDGTLASTLSWRGSRTEYSVEDPSERGGIDVSPRWRHFVPPDAPTLGKPLPKTKHVLARAFLLFLSRGGTLTKSDLRKIKEVPVMKDIRCSL